MNTPQIPGVPPVKVLNKKTLGLAIAVIVIVALGIGGYVYWKGSSVPQAPDLTGSTVEEVLPELNTSANPYQPVSETNPVEKTNPFTDVKTNPFE
ncbi:MAG: hypothetical protein UY31_C0049G0005 [Candidatus Wolfebacteria bacterium GW2011_GWE1_48_7]|uniref:Uncharacterized protein n=2 Tax=Candidatus Wolfeibacteriota TaxID=1752735 RepID=A0A0G1X5C5_9BACT|nr:MAG: hypothetical protein UX70_C0001G0786 [Candidatus Wolfebacteria bacterium GW2011_GWB1_47_1]KKU34716.1 MAG: hypothetical protein UX49_C0037G0010 [Candidatus Wolfebacteria bacterium GW2011_GWC2_46_275]KKU42291.1 MAG: hypothetical protein UX58_C0002G0005 [Candidatus Wolfebacteria bacterium GW2011_GWB2_46_69]KKU53704.1 MAG: hypothetical protein UX76_C0011G0049 [Candidatus Wolfebacteria bacterium GW2011_GWC1_47_103]KKU58948.1 MAG: hypothetical protein UX83_C0010G0070 [Candidatus Wolfebacteria